MGEPYKRLYASSWWDQHGDEEQKGLDPISEALIDYDPEQGSQVVTFMK